MLRPGMEIELCGFILKISAKKLFPKVWLEGADSIGITIKDNFGSGTGPRDSVGYLIGV